MKKLYSMVFLVTIPVFTALSNNKFNVLNNLVGHCWQATFPDGKKIDTHCFSTVYDGAFIKDEHVVCGPDNPYYGETWYASDGQNKGVKFRYFNSLGGVSEGPVRFDQDVIHFPEEKYKQEGKEITYKSTWTLKEGKYTSDMSQLVKEDWKSVWQMIFKQIDLASQDVVKRNSNQQLHCHQ